jgi:hypothetical protein
VAGTLLVSREDKVKVGRVVDCVEDGEDGSLAREKCFAGMVRLPSPAWFEELKGSHTPSTHTWVTKNVFDAMTKHHLVENRASRLTDEAEQGDGKKKKREREWRG